MPRPVVALAIATVALGVGILGAVAFLPDSTLSGLGLGGLFGAGRPAAHPSALPASAVPMDEPSPSPSDSPSPSPSARYPLLQAGPVAVTVSGYWSWAVMNVATGAISGSTNLAATSDTASMSKAWVAADYLRRAAERKSTPSADVMGKLSTMIRDSDNTNAYTFHVANGNLSSITRMISLCKLTDTKGVQNSWSLTRMSTRDITRLGLCLADGRAAGAKWTPWLLNEMRNVRGAGRFGVIQVLPPAVAKTTAIKNGWMLREDGLWHISCLAVGDGWMLGVQARYKGSLGREYGAKICASVGQQLMNSPA